MQFESLFVDFDPRKLTKAHPFIPEGYLDDYRPFQEPLALHYHDFLEIGYCESGHGLFYIDGKVIPFSGPCCTIIYNGQIHIAQAVDQESSLWHFAYISLKMLLSDTDLVAVDGLKAMSSHLYDFPALFTQEEDPLLYNLVSGILLECAEMKDGYLTSMRGMMTSLLTRHSRYMTPGDKVRENQEQVLDRLGDTLVYINQHYMDDLTIETLMEISGASKSTLQRDMISFTGLAPMQYIHHLRMKRAAILLTSLRPIADIAFDVGYNSLSSFNRHFLQEYGVSPSQWRKDHSA